jgi:hypothetical protein
MIRDRSTDDYDDERQPKKRTGCACFGPGEASGKCPGQQNCPMCQDDIEDVDDIEDEVDEEPGETIIEKSFALVEGMRKTLGTTTVAQEPKKCLHNFARSHHYDHVTCVDCGAIYTDSQWGIASNKWFGSLDIATFYKQNGYLPQAVGDV